jgi:hypothetical protein
MNKIGNYVWVPNPDSPSSDFADSVATWTCVEAHSHLWLKAGVYRNTNAVMRAVDEILTPRIEIFKSE